MPILLFLVAPGCGEERNFKAQVNGFVNNTAQEAREFLYSATEESGFSVEVAGKIEDTFRYQELFRMGGADVAEAVVDDDALGVRIIDASQIPGLASGFAPVPQIVVNALTSGQWVVDPSGAPPLQAVFETQRFV